MGFRTRVVHCHAGVAVLLVLGCLPLPLVSGAWAQDPQSPEGVFEIYEKPGAPMKTVVGHANKSELSPRLDAIEVQPVPAATRQKRVIHEIEEPGPIKAKQRKPAPHVDPAVQTSLAAPTTLAPAMPATISTFEGLGTRDNVGVFGYSVMPPDTNGDVGPNHFVQTVNLLVQVYNKSTGAPLLTAPLKISSLFAHLGGPCAASDSGDPVALYDPLADRWLLSELSVSGPPYHECIAVSQTADPTGAYFVYDFTMPNSKFNDYPKFGVWPDGYYMTDNQFSSLSGPFQGGGVFAFDRARMLAGDPTARYIYFDLYTVDSSIGGMLPADLDGPPPPAGAPNYFAYFTSRAYGDAQDGLRVFAFHADFAAPANSSFTERPESPIATAAFDPILSCGSSGGDCIPEPTPATSSARLNALSDRLMHRLQYRNFGAYESLVTNHTVDVDGSGHAGVRYYQLRRSLPGGPFAVNEQASFAPDSDYRWMGSAAMDGQGNLAVGYNVSSTTTFPSIRYAGRLATDPPNGLFQGEAVLQVGGGVQTNTNSRWGDYSMLAVDPVDDCTFWLTSEYYSATSSSSWQTRIGRFKFAQCGASTTLTPTPTAVATGTPTPTLSPPPAPTSTSTGTRTPTGSATPTTPPTATPTTPPTATPTSKPTTVTLVATQDAWIDAGNTTQNKGNDTKLRVKSSGPVRRTLVQFSLSSIPACATVTAADLQLTLTNKGNTSRTHNAHRLTRSWTETAVTWKTAQSATLWTAAGGDFNAAATASTATGTTSGVVRHWNVTNDVAAFVVGGAVNDGWVVKDATEGSGGVEFQYASSENGTVTTRPKLTVTYTGCP
jgi:hypothetical protein